MSNHELNLWTISRIPFIQCQNFWWSSTLCHEFNVASWDFPNTKFHVLLSSLDFSMKKLKNKTSKSLKRLLEQASKQFSHWRHKYTTATPIDKSHLVDANVFLYGPEPRIKKVNSWIIPNATTIWFKNCTKTQLMMLQCRYLKAKKMTYVLIEHQIYKQKQKYFS